MCIWPEWSRETLFVDMQIMDRYWWPAVLHFKVGFAFALLRAIRGNRYLDTTRKRAGVDENSIGDHKSWSDDGKSFPTINGRTSSSSNRSFHEHWISPRVRRDHGALVMHIYRI